MERRREPRIACYQRAALTLLGEHRRSFPCYVVQLSGQGMRIVLDEPLPVNAAVCVEIEDWMVLGEVCYARREYAHYAIGLQLDQAVMGLPEWAALRRNRLNDQSPRQQPSGALDEPKKLLA